MWKSFALHHLSGFFNYRAVDVEDVKVLWQICLPDSLPGSLSLSTTLEKLDKIFSPHFAVLVRGIHFLMLCKFVQSKSWLIFFWIWECFRLWEKVGFRFHSKFAIYFLWEHWFLKYDWSAANCMLSELIIEMLEQDVKYVKS